MATACFVFQPCPHPPHRAHTGETYPPELQALLHDRIGREEDQQPVGHHAGDVAWKCRGWGQGRGGASAGVPTSSWEQGSRIQDGHSWGVPGTYPEPSPGRTSTPQKTCTEPRGHCSGPQGSALPDLAPQHGPGTGLYRLSNAELSWAPSGPLGTTPTQIWCLSMMCGFSRQTGKGLSVAGGTDSGEGHQHPFRPRGPRPPVRPKTPSTPAHGDPQHSHPSNVTGVTSA